MGAVGKSDGLAAELLLREAAGERSSLKNTFPVVVFFVDSVFHFPVLELVRLSVEFTARFSCDTLGCMLSGTRGLCPFLSKFLFCNSLFLVDVRSSLLFIAEHPICNPVVLS
jgi:hypothetical protein